MGEPAPIVFVIDDDPSERAAIVSLLRSVALDVRCFASARQFLESLPIDAPACLILDIQPPGSSGLDVQKQLAKRDPLLSIVFIAGHGDIPTSVRAIKAGAVEFLPKPFSDQQLLNAIEEGLQRARQDRQLRAEILQLRVRFDSLTPRERQVMALVVTGMLNKQIAYDLSISEVTVKIHRRHVMDKMRADSVADLVRMGERLSPRS